MLLFFISTIIISYWILGIARLYIVWIIIFFYNLYLIYKCHLSYYGRATNSKHSYYMKLSEISTTQSFIDFFKVYLLYRYEIDVEFKQENTLSKFYPCLYDESYTHPHIYYLHLNMNHSNFMFEGQADCYQELFKFDSWLTWSWRALWNIWIKDYRYNFKKKRTLIMVYNKLKSKYNLDEKELKFLKEIYIRNICYLRKKGLNYNEIRKLYVDKGYMLSDNKNRENWEKYGNNHINRFHIRFNQ